MLLVNGSLTHLIALYPFMKYIHFVHNITYTSRKWNSAFLLWMCIIFNVLIL